MGPAGIAALCLGGFNLLVCLVYGLDKALARRGKRRISEVTLLSLAFLGGSLGAMAGMVLFHHKTDPRAHPGFVWGVPGMFLTELAMVELLVMYA